MFDTLTLTIEVKLDGASLDQLKMLAREVLQGLTTDEQARERRTRSAQRAVLGGHDIPTDKGLLLDVKEVAQMLGISPRTVSKMDTCGEMPKALRIGRAVRWSFDELQKWIAEGCPKVAQSQTHLP
jgi:excisionase family DNA binding protein